MTEENVGSRFDRVPTRPDERQVSERPTRGELLAYFRDRYGIDPADFEPYSFWEKGAGKIWALRGTFEPPVTVETLGIHILRTGGRHWKLTTDGAQLFGNWATRNVVAVHPDIAASFWAGRDQSLELDADDGYVIVAQRLTDDAQPLGVGLYIGGELRSMVPKGRRRDLPPLEESGP